MATDKTKKTKTSEADQPAQKGAKAAPKAGAKKEKASLKKTAKAAPKKVKKPAAEPVNFEKSEEAAAAGVTHPSSMPVNMEKTEGAVEIRKSAGEKPVKAFLLKNLFKKDKKFWIPFAAAALLLGGGIVYTVLSKTNNAVLATYTDAQGKTQKITVAQAIEDVAPMLVQAPPQAIEVLQDEDFKGLFNGVSLQPRIFLQEMLSQTNFRESEEYRSQLSGAQEALAYQMAYEKSIEEINKAVDREKVDTAEISRIFFKKTDDAVQNEGTLVQAQELLDELKAVPAGDELSQAFAQAAVERSQEPIGSQSEGYFGSVLKGAYPSLDPVLFEQKAAEGLYGELIDAPEAYYLLYVHAPAAQTKVGELAYSNPQLRNDRVTEYVQKSIKLSASYENGVLMLDGKEVPAETLNEDTVVARIWGKPQKAGILAETLAAVSGQGMVVPSPVELVQLISPADTSPYALRLAVAMKNSPKSIKKTKGYKKALIEMGQELDLQSIRAFVGANMTAAVDTNISAQELASRYEALTEKPVVGVSDAGDPIYADREQSMDILRQEILAQRSQDFFTMWELQIQQNLDVEWKEENLPAYQKAFLAKYRELTEPASAEAE